MGPPGSGEDDGGVCLAQGYGPVFREETVLLVGREEPVALLLVEGYRPSGGGPCADEKRLQGRRLEEAKESCADAVVSERRPDVGVSDEGDVAPVLDAHDAGENGVILAAIEKDAVVDLAGDLRAGHVGLVPAVVGYDAFVGPGRIVDDVEDGVEIPIGADAYHCGPSLADAEGAGRRTPSVVRA